MEKILLLLSVFALCTISCNKTVSKASAEEGKTAEAIKTEQAEVAETKPSADDLKQYFRKDTSKAQTIIQAKSVASSGNGVYCYFQLKENKASGLRMRIQYWDEKYADTDQYRFEVDGTSYDYIANRSKSGGSDARVVENASFYWFDYTVNKTDEAFLRALSTASKATLTLIDRATNNSVATINLLDANKKDIGRTLDYYFALNGAEIAKKGMVNIRQ